MENALLHKSLKTLFLTLLALTILWLLSGCLTRTDFYDTYLETNAPDITIKTESEMELKSEIGSCDFGTVPVGMSLSITVILENDGDMPLTVTDIVLDSGDVDSFQLDLSYMSYHVEPKSSTTFAIVFQPSVDGYFSAIIAVESDDPDENPYTVTVTGRADAAPIPDIHVMLSNTDLTSGSGAYDFGGYLLCSTSQTAIFTIENRGTRDLNISHIMSSDPSQFMVDTTSTSFTLQEGGVTFFTVAFSPCDLGITSATVSIASDDPDEDPYTFTLSGTGQLAAAPNILVRESGDFYPDGSTYTFGGVSGSVTRTFIIENAGNYDLQINGIHLTDGDPDFSLNLSSTLLTLPPGGTTTFDVTFSPTTAGTRSESLKINNNDPVKNPYDIELEGQLYFSAVESGRTITTR
jgi:hypothetical protein